MRNKSQLVNGNLMGVLGRERVENVLMCGAFLPCSGFPVEELVAVKKIIVTNAMSPSPLQGQQDDRQSEHDERSSGVGEVSFVSSYFHPRPDKLCHQCVVSDITQHHMVGLADLIRFCILWAFKS